MHELYKFLGKEVEDFSARRSLNECLEFCRYMEFILLRFLQLISIRNSYYYFCNLILTVFIYHLLFVTFYSLFISYGIYWQLAFS